MKQEEYGSIRKATCVLHNEQEFLKKIRSIAKRHDVIIVAVSDRLIAGPAHIQTAVRCALRAMNEGTMITRSPEMEILAYAAATRQTQEASRFGIHTGENDVFLCMIPSCNEALDDCAELEEISFDGEEWTSVPEHTPFLPTPEQKREIMTYFSISPDELAIVGEEEFTALVCERVVLLAINK